MANTYRVKYKDRTDHIAVSVIDRKIYTIDHPDCISMIWIHQDYKNVFAFAILTDDYWEFFGLLYDLTDTKPEIFRELNTTSRYTFHADYYVELCNNIESKYELINLYDLTHRVGSSSFLEYAKRYVDGLRNAIDRGASGKIRYRSTSNFNSIPAGFDIFNLPPNTFKGIIVHDNYDTICDDANFFFNPEGLLHLQKNSTDKTMCGQDTKHMVERSYGPELCPMCTEKIIGLCTSLT